MSMSVALLSVLVSQVGFIISDDSYSTHVRFTHKICTAFFTCYSHLNKVVEKYKDRLVQENQTSWQRMGS